MLATQTANLPAEQQQRLHADFLANEQAYLTMRDDLMAGYGGQWVAVHEGKVIASGTNLLAVTEAAAAVEGHPYIALVGSEEAVVFRVRSAVGTALFGHDGACPWLLQRRTFGAVSASRPGQRGHGDTRVVQPTLSPARRTAGGTRG